MGKYYLGIDVGKHEHQAALINDRQEMIGPSIRFKNNLGAFRGWLGQVKKNLPEAAEIKAGMESTGHYWINLNNFLRSTGIEDIQVINPIETQQISKTRIRKVKNDKIDSVTIARIISRCKKVCPPVNEKLTKLKRLTRFFDKVKRQEKFFKRELNACLELICPEFEGLFKNMFLRTPLAILRGYSDLRELKNTDPKRFAELLKKKSRSRIGEDKAFLILKTLQNSIGQQHWDNIAALQLKMLLDNLNLIEKQVSELKREIEILSDQFDEKKYVASVSGVSSISAAIYLAELGDINRFHDKHQLTAFAGIDASVFESGLYKRKQGNRISKRGSKYLRKQLYYAAKTAVIFDPELKRFYGRKKKEGKHYNVIMIAVARKILMRIYAVMKQKRLYEVRS